MSINLSKGQRVDVQLRRVNVGLGWEPPSNSQFEYDLDASAIMLDSRRKMPSERCFVFYNNQSSDDGSTTSSRDDRSGGSSGDSESISVDLTRVRPDVLEILFVVTIHEASQRRQSFGQVRNAFIRIVDADSGSEMAKFLLDEDASTAMSLEFGRLYRRNDQWRFEALGTGSSKDLGAVLAQYR
ncbi:MAG: TerD family protein [Deltaproteobacteria bacterium]